MFRAFMVLLIACVCGWFVMELEILGVRMLAPYFGSAVYVVTGSVIGVFLLSLALGYMLGGWLSTKKIWQSALGLDLLLAGLWVVALPLIDEPICDWIFRLGMDEKWGSLIASLALFGLPTILLGTVSPTVIRWLSSQCRHSGYNAGLVLAASTIASFAGCVVTAFYLVLLSMRQTLIISGLMIAALGISVFILSLLGPAASEHHLQIEPELAAADE
ncbi:MAG: fused MFS/spermidine synthase [Planctomycetaceae bacterium]|nr:fused MFS/spermidine synthase [Planctomycetaceae bacterium]